MVAPLAIAESAPSKATRREWAGLAVLALPCLMYSMDLNVLNLAIPNLSADLRPSSAELLWIVDIYGFVLAGALVTMGTLGDRIGRRKLLMTGCAAFGAASLFAGFAESAESLIASRAALGLAGATLAPSTLSLVRCMFSDPHERARAIGVWTGCFAAGSAIGPIVGGLLLQHFWWGSVFLISVPIMCLVLVLVPMVVPEFRSTQSRSLDIPSAAMITLATLATIYAIKRLSEYGLQAESVFALAAGWLLGRKFVSRQKHLPNPLVDIQLFRCPIFKAALGVNVVTVFSAFASFFFLSQYLQLVAGLSPLQASLWLLPSSVVMIAGSLIVPALMRRFKCRGVLTAGFCITAAGYAVMMLVTWSEGTWILLGGTILFSAALSPMAALTTNLILSTTSPERAGNASAISETSFEFGAALGIATLGSISTAVYRNLMSAADLTSLSSESLSAALSSLGATASVASGLPDEAGITLLHHAQGAFSVSMQVCAAMSFILAIAGSIACYRLAWPSRLH